VDLGALRHNCRLLRERVPTGTKVMAAVKADAYGHGLLPVSRVFAEEGVDWLGVAIVEEGLTLRRAGIALPMLVLGGLADGSEPVAVEAGLTPVVYRSASARALNALAARAGRPLAIHLKIDSGMSRLGVPLPELSEFLDLLSGLDHLLVDGVLTHLAEAENPDDSFTSLQLDRFGGAIAELRRRGHRPTWIHAANSAAVMAGHAPPTPAIANLVRPGLALYGCAPDPRFEGLWPLRPVMSFESAISFLKWIPPGAQVSYGLTWTAQRPTRLATLPVGYGDGYFRALGNRAHALVRGQRVPVVGRVCMDLALLDVTDVPHVREGDRAILVGQQGAEAISAAELASLLDTIPYEVICAISPRVPRVYHERAPGESVELAEPGEAEGP
jgi:alanine racemase